VYRYIGKHEKTQKKERGWTEEKKERRAIKHNTTFGEFGTFIINPIYLSRE